MNLELNVVKFENEDVIATSGVICDKHQTTHVNVIITEGTKYAVNYMYLDATMVADSGLDEGWYFNSQDPASGTPFSSEEEGWYYHNGDEFVECDGNHDADGYISKLIHK